MEEPIILEINQNSETTKGLSNIVNGYMNYNVMLDKEVIQIDINKLKVMLEKDITQTQKTNITNILKYLSKILKHCDSNTVHIRHRLSDKQFIRSDLFEVRSIPYYDINAINYFKIKDGTVIELDFSNIIDGINFECMYKDLGYDNDDINNKLKDIGVIGIYDLPDNLIEYGCSDDGMVMKIGDCPNKYGSDMYNYFNKKVDSVYYRETVETNENMALNCLYLQLCDKLAGENKFNVWRVRDKVITIYTTNSNCIKLIRELDGVVVRLFGRQFLFKIDKKIMNLG